MKRSRGTLLQPTRPGAPFQGRVTLADGTKSPRFDCPRGASEDKARAFVEATQALEDERGTIYAAKRERDTKARKAQGETVDQWHARYLPTKACGGEHRRVVALQWAKWISPVIGHEPMATLTTARVEDVRDAIDRAVERRDLRGTSPSNVWSLLTSALKAAAASKDRTLRVHATPLHLGILPPTKSASASRPWLFPREWERVWSCAETPRETRRLYAIALYTGLRPNELRALRWGDVDLEAMRISVSRAYDVADDGTKAPKTLAGIRVVPIEPALVPLLTPGARGDLVVTWRDVGTNHMAETFRDHLRAAGVTRSRLFNRTETDEPVDFRSLRDTYATWCALAGVPVAALRRRLGHESIETTDRYVKSAEAYDVDGVGEPFPPLATQTTTRTKEHEMPINKAQRVGTPPKTTRWASKILEVSAGVEAEEGAKRSPLGPFSDHVSDQRGNSYGYEAGLYDVLEREELLAINSAGGDA